MIIDLKAEINKRKSTPQKEEAIKILKNAIKDIEENGAMECIVAYNKGDSHEYYCNTGNILNFVGLLELTKEYIKDGF